MERRGSNIGGPGRGVRRGLRRGGKEFRSSDYDQSVAVYEELGKGRGLGYDIGTEEEPLNALEVEVFPEGEAGKEAWRRRFEGYFMGNPSAMADSRNMRRYGRYYTPAMWENYYNEVAKREPRAADGSYDLGNARIRVMPDAWKARMERDNVSERRGYRGMAGAMAAMPLAVGAMAVGPAVGAALEGVGPVAGAVGRTVLGAMSPGSWVSGAAPWFGASAETAAGLGAAVDYGTMAGLAGYGIGRELGEGDYGGAGREAALQLAMAAPVVGGSRGFLRRGAGKVAGWLGKAERGLRGVETGASAERAALPEGVSWNQELGRYERRVVGSGGRERYYFYNPETGRYDVEVSASARESLMGVPGAGERASVPPKPKPVDEVRYNEEMGVLERHVIDKDGAEKFYVYNPSTGKYDAELSEAARESMRSARATEAAPVLSPAPTLTSAEADAGEHIVYDKALRRKVREVVGADGSVTRYGYNKSTRQYDVEIGVVKPAPAAEPAPVVNPEPAPVETGSPAGGAEAGAAEAEAAAAAKDYLYKRYRGVDDKVINSIYYGPAKGAAKQHRSGSKYEGKSGFGKAVERLWRGGVRSTAYVPKDMVNAVNWDRLKGLKEVPLNGRGRAPKSFYKSVGRNAKPQDYMQVPVEDILRAKAETGEAADKLSGVLDSQLKKMRFSGNIPAYYNPHEWSSPGMFWRESAKGLGALGAIGGATGAINYFNQRADNRKYLATKARAAQPFERWLEGQGEEVRGYVNQALVNMSNSGFDEKTVDEWARVEEAAVAALMRDGVDSTHAREVVEDWAWYTLGLEGYEQPKPGEFKTFFRKLYDGSIWDENEDNE